MELYSWCVPSAPKNPFTTCEPMLSKPQPKERYPATA